MKFIALLICISTKDDSNRETYSISKSHAHTSLASSLRSDFPSFALTKKRLVGFVSQRLLGVLGFHSVESGR